MLEKRGDEVAEEGLSVGGLDTEMAVLEVAAGHGGGLEWESKSWMGRRNEGREVCGGRFSTGSLVDCGVLGVRFANTSDLLQSKQSKTDDLVAAFDCPVCPRALPRLGSLLTFSAQ